MGVPHYFRTYDLRMAQIRQNSIPHLFFVTSQNKLRHFSFFTSTYVCIRKGVYVRVCVYCCVHVCVCLCKCKFVCGWVCACIFCVCMHRRPPLAASRSKDTTSESMKINCKDGKIGLMKSLRQNWRRMTSSRSCYYQISGGLTRCQSLEVEDDGKGHTRKWSVGSVNAAYLKILILEVASVTDSPWVWKANEDQR